MDFQPDHYLAEPSECSASGTSAVEVRFLDCLGGSGLRDCFDFWRGCRDGERAPLKTRIDPVQMPVKILPNLFIYETIEGRYRCRLAGTEIVTVFHDDPTGRYLDELVSPAAVAGRTRLYDGVVRSGLPVVYGGSLAPASGSPSWVSFRRLLLPVSTTGTSIDIVFGMVVFPQFDKRARARSRLQDLPYDFEAWATPDDLDESPPES